MLENFEEEFKGFLGPQRISFENMMRNFRNRCYYIIELNEK